MILENTDYRIGKTDKRFSQKINKKAKYIGEKLIVISLKMYYAFKDKDTPMYPKIKIFGALLYFITPVDFIPDPIPFIGYTDDMFILIRSFRSIATNIKEEHDYQAKEYTQKLFKNL